MLPGIRKLRRRRAEAEAIGNKGRQRGDRPRQYKRAEAEGAAEGRSRGGEGGEGAEGKIKEPLTEVREIEKIKISKMFENFETL